MSGLMGDAEKIKFVFGKDTAEKIKARLEMMVRASHLPIETRAEMIMVMYGLTRSDLIEEINTYMGENFPEITDRKEKFDIWWQSIIAREKRDLTIVLKRLGGV